MRNTAGRGRWRSVEARESWFKGKRRSTAHRQVTPARLAEQRAFFSFPPPQQRPASGPNAVRRTGHLNAVRKGAQLRHRNLGTEQRTIVLVSGVSFSFEYSRCSPSANLFHLEQSRHRRSEADENEDTVSFVRKEKGCCPSPERHEPPAERLPLLCLR